MLAIDVLGIFKRNNHNGAREGLPYRLGEAARRSRSSRFRNESLFYLLLTWLYGIASMSIEHSRVSVYRFLYALCKYAFYYYPRALQHRWDQSFTHLCAFPTTDMKHRTITLVIILLVFASVTLATPTESTEYHDSEFFDEFGAYTTEAWNCVAPTLEPIANILRTTATNNPICFDNDQETR